MRRQVAAIGTTIRLETGVAAAEEFIEHRISGKSVCLGDRRQANPGLRVGIYVEQAGEDTGCVRWEQRHPSSTDGAVWRKREE